MGLGANSPGIQSAGGLMTDPQGITAADMNIFDVTRPPFNAKGDGVTNDRAAIQAAIDAARDQGNSVAFMPAGNYLVDGPLIVPPQSGLLGTSRDASNRATIILAANSGAPHVIGRTDSPAGTSYWYTSIQHFDIKIRSGNNNAVGVYIDASENNFMNDIHVDLTEGGYAGFSGMLGSGGSQVNLSVKGGSYGVIFSSGRPSPNLTGSTFEGQEISALRGLTRGSHLVVGCEFKLRNGAKVWTDIRTYVQATCTPVLVDCIIEYDSLSASNTPFDTPGQAAKGLTMINVHTRYAANIISDQSGMNPSGWVHYRELIFDNPSKVSIGGRKVHKGVWENGSLVLDGGLYLPGDSYTVSAEYEGPGNLTSRHRLPLPFPSWESEGAINVADFSSYRDGDDWAPAFNAAIEAAATMGSNIVAVPIGEYLTRSSICLKEHTRLVGCHASGSVIIGRARTGSPFWGDETDYWKPWHEAPAMIETPDDPHATCILANISIRPDAGRETGNHLPTGFSGVRWRAGRNSIISNINPHQYKNGAYRNYWSLEWIFNAHNIRHTASPVISGNLEFHSDGVQKYHTYDAIPSRIMVEAIDGNERIAPRSIDPLSALWAGNTYDMANIMIKGKNGATGWNLESLRIANAHLNPRGADRIYIEGYSDGSVAYSQELNWRGQERPREEFHTLTLNWDQVDSVLIRSLVPFALDDVSGNDGLSDFDGISSIAFSNEGATTFNNEHGICKALNMGYEAYPLMNNQPKIVYTGNGGGRYYNYVTHGNQFMTAPYMYFKDTREPLNIYHLHAQHCPQSMPRFILDNADNISIYGAKNEMQFTLLEASNCDNFTFLGGGGLYNPAGKHNAVRLHDCANYRVGAIDWEIYAQDGFTRSDYWNEMLSRDFPNENSPQGQEWLVAYHDGEKKMPDSWYRPMLWKYGNPFDAWNACNTKTYWNSPADSEIFSSGTSISFSIDVTSECNIDSVRFMSGDTILATLTTSPYNHTWTGAADGKHTLKALAYTEREMNEKKIEIIVGSVVSITHPSDGQTLDVGQNIIEVNVEGEDVSSVSFYIDGEKAGEDDSSPYSFTWEQKLSGEYTIRAEAGNASDQVKVTLVAELYIDKTELTFTAEESMQTVEVVSNTDWKVNSGQDWLSVSPSAGNGNGSFSVTASRHTSADARDGIITVSGNGIVHEITVHQEGTGLSVESPGNQQMMLSPNPVAGMFTLSGIQQFNEIRVLDSTGQVKLIKENQNLSEVTIDTNNLSIGTYIVHLRGAEETLTTRFVKIVQE